MKILIDIDKLLAEGQIAADEYDRLKAFSQKDTGSLALNILVGFGVIATAAGAAALLPSSWTVVTLGTVLAVMGISLTITCANKWGLLGSILLLVGSVNAAAGVVALAEGGVTGYLIVTGLLAAAAFMAKSALLSVLSALALAATAGAATGYGHATYTIAIRQPTITIALFSVAALAAYHLSKRVPPEYERVALAFSRTSVFLVNLGFWVGSLWGDSFGQQHDSWRLREGAVVPDMAFVIGWAVAIVATGAWAARANKRWVVNLLAVFGAIHFFTQFFERLGASPGSILVAGLVALAIAFGIGWYNKSPQAVTDREAHAAS